ncbi:Polymorphic outer membrane protein [Seminavis robusta]|uniref:Polymorphic outer membrane protein n=1 Tax=Seminavis robusta TaxID=568900 RepID=A0A9N8EIV8_9STRA|nr:Polymorphic outer membrane protein [Seminavis robusta]|eukprot:Sro1069_g237570.1 Polymorphic outer membrane protein (766) ;mRNA; r:13086-15383
MTTKGARRTAWLLLLALVLQLAITECRERNVRGMPKGVPIRSEGRQRALMNMMSDTYSDSAEDESKGKGKGKSEAKTVKTSKEKKGVMGKGKSATSETTKSKAKSDKGGTGGMKMKGKKVKKTKDNGMMKMIDRTMKMGKYQSDAYEEPEDEDMLEEGSPDADVMGIEETSPDMPTAAPTPTPGAITVNTTIVYFLGEDRRRLQEADEALLYPKEDELDRLINNTFDFYAGVYIEEFGDSLKDIIPTAVFTDGGGEGFFVLNYEAVLLFFPVPPTDEVVEVTTDADTDEYIEDFVQPAGPFFAQTESVGVVAVAFDGVETGAPTSIEIEIDTDAPTPVPETAAPTMPPTVAETATPTMSPTLPETATPTMSPTVPETATPTVSPTLPETATPTMSPTLPETATPTMSPTVATSEPTIAETLPETAAPTVVETEPEEIPVPEIPETGAPTVGEAIETAEPTVIEVITDMPTLAEIPVVETAEPTMVDVPVVETEEPTMVDVPVVETAEPTVVDVPVVETAEPTMVDVPVVETAEPTMVDVPVVETAEPTAVDVPVVETAEPTAVEELPVVETAQPTAMDVPVVETSAPTAAASDPAVVTSPPTTGSVTTSSPTSPDESGEGTDVPETAAPTPCPGRGARVIGTVLLELDPNAELTEPTEDQVVEVAQHILQDFGVLLRDLYGSGIRGFSATIDETNTALDGNAYPLGFDANILFAPCAPPPDVVNAIFEEADYPAILENFEPTGEDNVFQHLTGEATYSGEAAIEF